jgi:hypothetical protein
MGVPGDPTKQQVDSNLDSIVDTAERLVASFRERDRRTRIARSLTIGLLGCAVTLTIVFAFLVTDYFSEYFNSHPTVNGALFVGIAAVSWLGCAAVAYLLLNRRTNQRLEELSALTRQIKKDREAETTTENALSLAERVIGLLPDIVKKRTEDSLLFGFLAFIVTLLISRFPPVAILAGVGVWLFFRYATDRSYQREIARFEEQKLAFERRKKEFIESL